MASSGNWRQTAGVAIAASALVAGVAACGDSNGPPAPSAAPSTPALDLDVPLGRPIEREAATHFLPIHNGAWEVQPAAAYGQQFLVSETRIDSDSETAVQRFALWDPVNGARRYAWDSEPGHQDIVAGIEGDLAVYVRTGLALPFADWRLEARDLATGETRTIAQADGAVQADPAVRPSPPFGFAPHPNLGGGRMIWAEYVQVDGATAREIRMYDFSTRQTVKLARLPLAGGGSLESPTIGSGRAAWVRWLPDGTSRLVVHDLGSASERELDFDARPFAIALDATGRTLAWDDARGGKYSVRLDGGTPRLFAGDEGWGVTASGSRFSWAPAAAYGGTGGYFDLETDELRLVARQRNVQVNYAAVLGSTFTWQELATNKDGSLDEAKSGYYFLPLDT